MKRFIDIIYFIAQKMFVFNILEWFSWLDPVFHREVS